MLESAHVFGRYDHLVGVCTRPLKADHSKAVGVLMLTPGMLHHVGPFGLHVAIARRLSELGFYSMRFCLSGIGESLGVGVAGCSTERATDEVRQAMDWMSQQYNIQQFVTFGLCSGADDSVFAALRDERVVGSVLMDGCGYRTKGFYARKYCWRLPLKLLYRLQETYEIFIKSKASARKKLRALWRPALDGSSIAQTLPAGEDIREFPERGQAEKDFQRLVDRGVKLLLLYTGGVSQYFNGQRQLREMFPNLKDRGNLQCHYYPHLDHVARLTEDRRLIVDLVARWMTQWQQLLELPASNVSKVDRNPQDCKLPYPITTSPLPISPNPISGPLCWSAGSGSRTPSL